MKRKLLVFAAFLAVVSCAEKPGMTWEKHVIDGHRTGVTAVKGLEVDASLGTLDGKVYTSPNGKKFSSGSTPAVAEALISVQPQMTHLKEVLGHSPRIMGKKGKNAGLAEWSVDAVMKGTEATIGRKVDVGIINYGGIRIDMPEGDVLCDDIVSMFPFKNMLCYLSVRGSDLRSAMENMVRRKNIQALGGVKMVVSNGKLLSLMVGDKPLDDKKIYGVATLDFLLDGGDGLYLAKNAKELIISDMKLSDWMVPYVRSLTAAGKEITWDNSEKWLVYKKEETK